jgi:ABC-type bacteriocin/lantibiotic exporter with double-glycine peptidase domain
MRRRGAAAFVLASFALIVTWLGATSRDPLRPLRAFTRWSLERRGARFIAQGGARLQSSLNDCGPTALADLLELSGLPVPPPDSLRRLAATKPNGTTLGELGAAAGTAGLRVFPVRWDPAELALLPLPSLVWVDRNHFVVVARRARSDSVEVHDPAAGRYRMAGERFARLWSGEALVPLDSISPRRKSDRRSVIRPHRLRGTRAVRTRTTEV